MLVSSDADVGLVDGAGRADQIAQMPRGAFAIAREFGGRRVGFPAALRDDPARRGEMMERHHRRDVMLVAGGQHAPIVIQLSQRELAVLRLDARPLD